MEFNELKLCLDCLMFFQFAVFREGIPMYPFDTVISGSLAMVDHRSYAHSETNLSWYAQYDPRVPPGFTISVSVGSDSLQLDYKPDVMRWESTFLHGSDPSEVAQMLQDFGHRFEGLQGTDGLNNAISMFEGLVRLYKGYRVEDPDASMPHSHPRA